MAQHWPIHKRTCSYLTPLDTSPSSIPTVVGQTFTVNAILFPASESAPRLVKATFKVKDYEGKIWHSFVVGQFDIERREMGYLQVSNYPKGPMLPLEHQMTLFWRDCFFIRWVVFEQVYQEFDWWCGAPRFSSSQWE